MNALYHSIGLLSTRRAGLFAARRLYRAVVYGFWAENIKMALLPFCAHL
jgi:hypothetical protein